MWFWGLYHICREECQEGQAEILKDERKLQTMGKLSSFSGNFSAALKAL